MCSGAIANRQKLTEACLPTLIQKLAKYYKLLDKEQSHRAKDDVLLNERVLEKLKEEMHMSGGC
jgi:hypothetical protein